MRPCYAQDWSPSFLQEDKLEETLECVTRLPAARLDSDKLDKQLQEPVMSSSKTMENHDVRFISMRGKAC